MPSKRAQARERLAVYLEGQAAWRQSLAGHYPQDERHRRSAEGLRALATCVRGLPEDDDRVRTLACLDIYPSVPFVASERAGEVARRYAFGGPPEPLVEWLDRFLDALAHDRVAELEASVIRR